MKWILVYIAMAYITFCANDVEYEPQSIAQQLTRSLLWPWTLTVWFRSQSARLHRLLNILWCVLIAGWLMTLMLDRL